MKVLEGKVSEMVPDGARYALIKIGDQSIRRVFFKSAPLSHFVQYGRHCKLYAIAGPLGVTIPVAVEANGGKYYSSVVNVFTSILLLLTGIFFVFTGVSSGGYWWLFGASLLAINVYFDWLPFIRWLEVPKSGFTKI